MYYTIDSLADFTRTVTLCVCVCVGVGGIRTVDLFLVGLELDHVSLQGELQTVHSHLRHTAQCTLCP